MYLRVFSHLLLHIDRSPSPLYGRISGDRQHEHSDPVLLGPEGAGCAGRASGVDLRPRVEAGRLEGYAGGEKPAWYESTLVTCLWVTAIFAMMGLLSYYFTKIDELDGQCVKGVVET